MPCIRTLVVGRHSTAHMGMFSSTSPQMSVLYDKIMINLKSGGWLHKVLTFEMRNPEKFLETLK